jgi:hypothetical protein
VWNLEVPFDVRFRDITLETVAHLFDCGFGVVYLTAVAAVSVEHGIARELRDAAA